MAVHHVDAAHAAIEVHKARLKIVGDPQIQVWHLLMSLREFCRWYSIDADSVWADVCSEEPALREG